MTLLLWKAPLVPDAEEAAKLLAPFYEQSDDSAFEPSAALAVVADELLRRFPDAEDGPWADSGPERAERILVLDIRWGADNAVIDAIVELAKQHELVLYDPQGPDVHLPGDVDESVPDAPPRLIDHLKVLLMAVGAAATFWLGWRADNPVLHWLLMIVGGFFLSVILFVAWIIFFGKDDPATAQPR